MPYKDSERQRQYQLDSLKQRRLAWLKEHGPCTACASWEGLQVDHVDPAQKVSHRIWSWSEARRKVELQKCQPLCLTCHKAKTRARLAATPITHGTVGGYDRGCRCGPCRVIQSERCRAWKARRKMER